MLHRKNTTRNFATIFYDSALRSFYKRQNFTAKCRKRRSDFGRLQKHRFARISASRIRNIARWKPGLTRADGRHQNIVTGAEKVLLFVAKFNDRSFIEVCGDDDHHAAGTARRTAWRRNVTAPVNQRYVRPSPAQTQALQCFDCRTLTVQSHRQIVRTSTTGSSTAAKNVHRSFVDFRFC